MFYTVRSVCCYGNRAFFLTGSPSCCCFLLKKKQKKKPFWNTTQTCYALPQLSTAFFSGFHMLCACFCQSSYKHIQWNPCLCILLWLRYTSALRNALAESYNSLFLSFHSDSSKNGKHAMLKELSVRLWKLKRELLRHTPLKKLHFYLINRLLWIIFGKCETASCLFFNQQDFWVYKSPTDTIF